MNNKYFDLLPIQHQTSVNKNFFESTVEQLFAKSNLEQISGFVGRKVPGVDNNTNTVFIEQPAPNREYYNLEPTVTTMKQRSINSMKSIKEKRTLPFEIVCKK